MRVAALGRTKVLWNSIRQLNSENHDIVFVATCRAAPEYDVREDDFRELAVELGAEFLAIQSLNKTEVVEKLRDCRADIAVSVNWINIIGPEACGAFRYGVLNAHAGDLPRYRGNAPAAWAILQGEDRIGLTIHRMDPYGLDSGPIFLKDYFPLNDETYIGEVLNWIEVRSPVLFARAVNAIEHKKLEPTAQPLDPSLFLRCYPRRPDDGLVDWGMSAQHLGRLVRASSEPFAGAYSYYKGERITIWRARAEPWPCPSLAIPGQVVQRNLETGEVTIAAGEGRLVLEEVQLNNQTRTKPAMILKSLRDRLELQ